MPRFRKTYAVVGLAITGLVLSAPASLAANPYHQRQVNPTYSHAQSYYDEGNGGYGEGNEAAFPNTEDHSAECVNGYRYIRHNYDWFKSTAETSLPVACH